jgi:hypothetical protein
MRQTTAAHQQHAKLSSVNKNAAFVALRPGSSAQLYEALLPVELASLTLLREMRLHSCVATCDSPNRGCVRSRQ